MPDPQFDIPAAQRQAIVDHEQLRLLAIGHWISGGMSSLYSLFGLLYMGMGVLMQTAMSAAPMRAGNGQAPPPEVFWIFVLVGLAMFVFMISNALMNFRAAWCLKRHRGKVLCLITAGFNCFFIPYGTLLGVFTFVVLGRASVQALYEGA